MSISLGNLAVVERTLRIEISTPYGEDPSVKVFREILTTDEKGAALSRAEAPGTVRWLSKIADQKFEVGGLALTGAQVAGIIAAISDVWRQEDIAAAASAAAATGPTP